MNARVEPLRAGLALLTAVAMVAAMMLLFGSAPALGQAGNPPSVECAGACGFNNEWWKIQITGDGTEGTIETSENVDSDDIDFSIDDFEFSWTNQSSDGFAVVRVVEKSGQTSDDVHNGVWLVGEGFSDEEVASDISHITFCFAAAPTTTVPEETTTTTEATTTTTAAPTTTVATAPTTTIEDEILGTVITAPTTTVAAEVEGTQVLAEELPFTGPETGWLLPAAVLLLISGLMITGLTGNSRED